MTTVRLIHGGYGLLSQYDITNSPKYQNVVLLIDNIRQSLCNNAAFRQPFHDVLLSLYNDSNTSAAIKRIRPNTPTEHDVFDFFAKHWPTVRLVPLCSTGTSYKWGYAIAGTDAANEGIHVSCPLVNFWKHMVRNISPIIQSVY